MTLFIPAPVVMAQMADTVDAASYAFASIAPLANRWLCVDFAHGVSAGTPNAPTVSGLGLTWATETTALSTTRRFSRAYAFTGSSPTPDVITCDLAGQTQVFGIGAVLALQLDLADPFVQSDPATGTGPSVAFSLAAYGDAANRPLVGVWHGANETTTPEAGYRTALDIQTGSAPNIAYLAAYNPDTADTSPTASWTTSAGFRGAASEMKAGTLTTGKHPPRYSRREAVHRASRW